MPLFEILLFTIDISMSFLLRRIFGAHRMFAARITRSCLPRTLALHVFIQSLFVSCYRFFFFQNKRVHENRFAQICKEIVELNGVVSRERLSSSLPNSTSNTHISNYVQRIERKRSILNWNHTE